jgi:hypothetical protein
VYEGILSLEVVWERNNDLANNYVTILVVDAMIFVCWWSDGAVLRQQRKKDVRCSDDGVS